MKKKYLRIQSDLQIKSVGQHLFPQGVQIHVYVQFINGLRGRLTLLVGM